MSSSTPDKKPVNSPFAALPPHVDLPKLDSEIIEFWDRDETFKRALESGTHRPQWTFYEGPPTANGKPGVHHVEARAFKDIFPRLK
ncbi:MAG TPA: class I tRNA ligase family protein, partial [Mycobacteriales bacterium]|nr:class I tRNA ligase family protein [Mycobacteriales bacterium]